MLGRRHFALATGAAVLGSPAIGRTLGESPIGRSPLARVIAMSEGKTPYRYNPSAEVRLAAGSRLVLLGKTADVDALRREVNGE